MEHQEIKWRTDEEILLELRAMGLPITLEDFKKAALKAKAPSKLSEEWSLRYGIQGSNEDFLYEACLELWKRHLEGVKCVEVSQDLLFDVISFYEDIQSHNKDTLLKIYHGIERFHRHCLKEDGRPDIEFFRQVEQDAYHDVESFLLEIPHVFAQNGLVDEAVNIGRWFGEFSREPENFYRDLGYILAKAGRKEEAIRQVEENLKRFPEDLWVVLNAGDAYYLLGDRKAEAFYLKGYEMAGDQKYDRLGAIERLIDFYRWQEMEAEAKRFEEEYRQLTASRVSRPEPQRKAPKIGRNDPCPCGSGKKYKKCCLNKTPA
ncbi:MAG: SEC-C metal-binding domain-containing protein [Desulfobacterota bacterium]|nr:SEC-C metal-binding domain-containing protein [Thermodesulfobacteriota bacterium]